MISLDTNDFKKNYKKNKKQGKDFKRNHSIKAPIKVLL